MYPNWRLLLYAIRPLADDEPRLQRVVQLVEELVEEAVQGLSTLSIDTLRWLRSPRPQEIDVRPFSRLQNQASQLRAARLWARLLCYCLRIVAIEKGAPSQQREPELELAQIARLFPWHGKQKLAAERLWLYLSFDDNENNDNNDVGSSNRHQAGRYSQSRANVRRTGPSNSRQRSPSRPSSSTESATVAKQRTYVLRLSQALICQEVYHQPFHSGLVHFLAALGVHPDTGRLRTAAEFSSLLSSLVYCIRALTVEIALPSSQRTEQGVAETRSFLACRAKYLVDGSYSPISVILSLLSYAKFISLRTPSSIASSM